jgi:hypothetical protein
MRDGSEEYSAMGYFLMATAVIVLFPVFLQVRAKEHGLRAVWGYFLFAAGLFTVGVAEAFLEATARRDLTIAGFAAILIGLFVQEGLRGGMPRKY